MRGLNDAVYLKDESNKRLIGSKEVFNKLGFDWKRVIDMGSEVEKFPDGPPVCIRTLCVFGETLIRFIALEKYTCYKRPHKTQG